MHRVDATGHYGNTFTDGGSGVEPTTLAAKWHNAVQEELANVIEFTGDTLSAADNTQLLTNLIPHIPGATALRAIAPVNGYRVYLQYHTTAGDGGHGVFRGVTGAAAATYTHDGGIYIVPSGGDGSAAWIREISTDGVHAAWYGALAPTTLQSVITYCEANGGPKIYLPAGFYNFSSGVTITKGLEIIGHGIGLGSGTGNSGGTVIRNTSASGDVFTISSAQSVVLRDFTIDAPNVTKNSGTAGIRIQGSGGSGNVNRRSRVRNVRILNMYDAIYLDSGSDAVIEDCHIQDFLNIGIYSKQTGGTDDGQSTIAKNVIWDLNVGTSQAAIRYDKGGDLRIVSNKILGSDYGFRVVLDDGETGTLLITNNSFEEQLINDIRISQGVVGKNLGNVIIVGNQLSIIAPATPQNNIAIVSGTPGGGATCWVKGITITGNVINNAHTAAYAAISVQDGEGFSIVGNTICGSGQTNPTGIDAGGNATSGKICSNVVFDMPSGAYSDSALGFKVPTAIVRVSSGVATVAAGSTVFLGDGVSATEAQCLFYLPYKAKLLNLHCHASTAPTGADTFVYTARVNGGDTALTCTTSGANTDSQDRSNRASVPSPAGPNTAARVSLKLVTSGSAAAAVHHASFMVTEVE